MKKEIFEGGLHIWLEKLFDAVALNLLWLLCCLPVITIGASCAAFYYAWVKVLRSERGHLFAEFWKSFRLNLFKGTALWLLFAALLFLLGLNRNIAVDIGGPYLSLFLICLYTFIGLLAVAIALYVFPVLSRFEMGVIPILKLSVYMCFRYFPLSLAMLALAGVLGFVLYYVPFLVVCLPVLFLYPFSYLMEKALFRHSPRSAEENAEDEQKWYFSLIRNDRAYKKD